MRYTEYRARSGDHLLGLSNQRRFDMPPIIAIIGLLLILAVVLWGGWVGLQETRR